MPVDGSGLARMAAEKPLVAPARDRYVYFPNTQSVPFFAGPRVLNRPHSITVDVEIPPGGAEGVLLCQGTAAGGYSLFVKDGRLHYVHNYVGRGLHRVSSPEPIPDGAHRLRFEFEPTGQPDLAQGRGTPGRLQLYVDGTLVAEATPPSRRRSSSIRDPQLRRQPRLPGHTGLPLTVPVHRNTALGRRRRVRRPHRRQRERAAHGDGPP